MKFHQNSPQFFISLNFNEISVNFSEISLTIFSRVIIKYHQMHTLFLLLPCVSEGAAALHCIFQKLQELGLENGHVKKGSFG